jgi:hypothetical protein
LPCAGCSMELYRSAIGEKAAKARGAKKLQEGEGGIFVTDYLVYKVNGELILHSHCQDAEEDLLLHDFVPGEDVVVVTDPAREGSETLEAAATREARMYFRGEHQEPKRIDCWVAGALERQKCLKASAPSNSS